MIELLAIAAAAGAGFALGVVYGLGLGIRRIRAYRDRAWRRDATAIDRLLRHLTGKP